MSRGVGNNAPAFFKMVFKFRKFYFRIKISAIENKILILQTKPFTIDNLPINI